MPAVSPKVVSKPGELPPFWPHRVVFFANLRALFYGNAEETQELCEIVGNVESYGGRLLPVLNLLFRGTDNALILEREPDLALHRYFADALGLSLPNHQVLDHHDYLKIARAFEAGQIEKVDELLPDIADWPDRVIDGYVTDPTLIAIAGRHELRTICTLEGSWRGNNKLLLHQFLESEGHPVFDTTIVERHSEIAPALEQFRKNGYKRAVIKAQIGASGIGLHRLDLPASNETLVALPGMLFYEGPCMVQGWLEPGINGVVGVRSPSVQMFVGDESVHLYDITEQILSRESVHEGNEAIPEFLADHPELQEDLLQIAGAAARWLHGEGYRGLGSADFVVIYNADGCPRKPILCEVNARVTGATYPSVLARHLTEGGSWLMRNVRFQRPPASGELLRTLRHQSLLFHRGDTRGAIPINFNPDENQNVAKAQFLGVAPTLAECREIMDSLHDQLPLRVDYDRD